MPTAGLFTSLRNCQNSRGLMRNRCSALQFSHPIRTPERAAFSPSERSASRQRWYTSLYGTSAVTRPATSRIASVPSSTAVSISRSTMRTARARTLGSRDERGEAQCNPVETLDTTRPASATLRRSSRTSLSAVLSWNHGTSPSHSSMLSQPACLTSDKPLSNPHSFAIMLSPMAFFIARLLQARQVAGVIIAVQMNERFGGEHTDLASAPMRHDLVVLPPDAVAVLAAVREQGGLFLFDH